MRAGPAHTRTLSRAPPDRAFGLWQVTPTRTIRTRRSTTMPSSMENIDENLRDPPEKKLTENFEAAPREIMLDEGSHCPSRQEYPHFRPLSHRPPDFCRGTDCRGAGQQGAVGRVARRSGHGGVLAARACRCCRSVARPLAWPAARDLRGAAGRALTSRARTLGTPSSSVACSPRRSCSPTRSFSRTWPAISCASRNRSIRRSRGSASTISSPTMLSNRPATQAQGAAQHAPNA